MIELNNIRKSFQQGQNEIQVLRDVNLKVEAGETIAILGPSGSGKSTLLNLVSGIDIPSEGEILFAGEKFSSLNQKDRDKIRFEKLGFVFQQFNLLPHLNVLENVLFPLHMKKMTNAESVAREYIEKVDLLHRIDHFTETLSGGEKQRVAIARALAGGPQLILADEPSGSLDVDNGEKIINLFFDLIKKSNSAMILVTHNPSLAKFCDKKYMMEKGGLNLA